MSKKIYKNSKTLIKYIQLKFIYYIVLQYITLFSACKAQIRSTPINGRVFEVFAETITSWFFFEYNFDWCCNLDFFTSRDTILS